MDNTEIIRQINDAWLNIDVAHKDVFNPFEMLSTEDADDFYKKLTWLLMQPDYFSFICKHILNIELLPIQCLVLKEIWGRKFPMLVGSRGFGKALKPTEKIRVKHGWKEIQHIEVGDQVYGSDGNLCNVQYKTELQTDLKFYRIFLDDGRTIDCCEDHLWKVWDGQWQVLKTKNMIENCTNYAIPINKPLNESDTDLPIHPYVVGFLLGAPCSLRTKTVKILSKDEECVEKVNKLLPYGYEITGPVGDYLISKFNETFRSFSELCDDIGIYGLYSEERFIPDQYKYSGRNNAEFLLRGLMDGGSFYEGEQLVFSTFSERLRDDVIDLMRSLGIKCVPDLFHRENRLPNYRIMVYPNENKNYIQKIEPINNHNGYCIQVDSPDRTYITKNYIVTHNTFLLSLYCMLRALLLPGRKIVVVGAAFRQSKFLYEYMDTIWKNAPILRDICDKNSGPRSQIDMCRMTLNGSIISALPIGDGSKIRGMRANDIIADEFACLERNTLIQTDLGLIKIKDYLDGNVQSLVNINGELETPDKIFITPKTDVYKITTQNGYSFQCSSIHKVLSTDGWKIAKDLTNKDKLFLDVNDFFPSDNQVVNDVILDDKLAWLMGILVSEGTVTNRNYISIKNTDKQLIDKILQQYSEYNWGITYKEAYQDGRGWNCNESWELKYSDTDFRTTLRNMGVDYVTSHDKEIPSGILKSPRSTIIAFLSGLFEGDGTAFNYVDKGKKRIGVAYYSVNETLITQLQILLLKFGIVSSKTKKKSKISKSVNYMLSIRGENAYKIYELLNVIKWKDKFNNADFLVKKPTIIKRGNRLLCQTTYGNKNKHLGVFDTIEECEKAFEDFYKTARVVIKVKSVEKLPEQEVLYDFHMPETHSFIGNGFVQHNSMNRDIFENVIAGFGAVAAKPSENVQKVASAKKAKELNFDISTLYNKADEYIDKSNQIVLSGTAYYDFNHFAAYWKKWKTIIESGGDSHFIKNNVFNGELPPASFNWEDYSVIRIPVDLVPEGFMDEGQIARSKATVHNGIYLMEFGACGHPQTPIVTQDGIKPIIDVKIGDKVLTHKGRFKPVLKKTFRPYNGQVLKIKSYGYYQPLIFTIDHPFWENKDIFQELREIDHLSLAPLHELSNKVELSCVDICTNFVERDDYIYPRSSQSKITNEHRTELINRYKKGETAKSLAQSFGLSTSGVYQIIYDKRKPKNSLNKNIRLDLNFGKVVGYYASEGSIGSDGRTCEFALDGHVNETLETYIQELDRAIYESTGIIPKCYKKKRNTISVCINSRVFSEVIKNICPGDCYTKLIKHDILFSNKEFLKGFIIGVWNGDGHIRKDLATIQLTNKNLINQIKMALSCFGINSSFLKVNKKSKTLINGKPVNQSNAWKLNISGNDFVKFMSIFYNTKIENGNRKNKIRFEESCIYDFKNRELIDYNGFVYNLEVDEDHSYSTPNATMHNCFTTDSQGFFKRSLIESCVGTRDKPVLIGDKEVYFDPVLKGNSKRRYIMGVDPASEVDNFSIVILEVHEDHRRIVYSWTTTRQGHIAKVQKKLVDDNNFYSYCARKIRELTRLFNVEHIAIDAQGGIAVYEALHDSNQLKPDELPFWEVIEDDKPKETDDQAGLHIIEMCQFAKYEWYAEANHGLRKDLENKVLIFPRFDPVTIGLSIEEDVANNRIYDTLEDCVMEIEELKNELSLIEITASVNGRERWDTPEVKVGVGKKERMRKDRYSSLLMANMAARRLSNQLAQAPYTFYGGFAEVKTKKKDEDSSTGYTGPAWFTEQMKDVY